MLWLTWCIMLSDNIGKVVNRRLPNELDFTSFIIFLEAPTASLANTYKPILALMSCAWYEAVHVWFQFVLAYRFGRHNSRCLASWLLPRRHFIFEDSFSKQALSLASAYFILIHVDACSYTAWLANEWRSLQNWSENLATVSTPTFMGDDHSYIIISIKIVQQLKIKQTFTRNN